VNARTVGVYREREFSPGKVDADAAILDEVLAVLAGQGVATRAVTAGQFAASDVSGEPADLVLAMCQSEAALEQLLAAQNRGAAVLNSARAIRNCYRDRLGAVLADAGVAVPAGRLVEVESFDACDLEGLEVARGLFVKRGDLHAMVADDVRQARSRAEIDAYLEDFVRRGVKKAYLQQAVEGRVIKFYGVTDTYFSIAQADLELPPGLPELLHQAATAAAQALELQVWGGDAVVDGQRFSIIDFNDWPSFQAVRRQAAPAIARRALALLAGR
jgi:protein-tyrosine-phosphatase